jgi:hypothetical protein
MGIVIMGVALFWPAGKIDWWLAWAALSVRLAWSAATARDSLDYCKLPYGLKTGPFRFHCQKYPRRVERAAVKYLVIKRGSNL